MTKGNNTPIGAAVHAALHQGGGMGVLLELLRRGADPGVKGMLGNAGLHMAAQDGHTEVVKALLDHGARVDATNDVGQTPLHRAAALGHVDTAKLLMDRGAQVVLICTTFNDICHIC